MLDVVIVGSVALDTVKTPFGRRENVLGGSASFASAAASFFCKPGLVGIVGKDFPQENVEFFRKRGIDTKGLVTAEGKTFHWEGEYSFDLNQAKTIKTDLNVFQTFNPILPKEYRKADYLFLGNIMPELQLQVLGQMERRPKLVLADTMNLWIQTKKEKVLEVVKKADICLMNDAEARQLFNTSNLLKAAREILKLDSEMAIIKKGEHGCILFTEKKFFAVPGYPLENVVDPTGAGDSFAGTLIGYISKAKSLDESEFRRALVYASSVASFNAEGFSLEKLKEISLADINGRFKEFKEIVQF